MKVFFVLLNLLVALVLVPFALDWRFCDRVYRDTLSRANLPEAVVERMRSVHVVLCNRYYRWYFATRDERFRVTVDTQMTYYQVRKVHNTFSHHHMDRQHVVVELKYPKPQDVEAERVSRRFPFSVTKNSKYVTGIERVYL